ncbi:MAG: hypothetical protein LUH53_06120, partial [Lachnospiraceae bacterium]|nr:hypothetical protein [Lachnospiraceae bacterium]
EPFYTVKGLPFQYTVRGGELFVDRRSKSITKATVQKAYDRILGSPEEITGPKKLNAFGAPYIWAIFQKFGIVGGGKTKQSEGDRGCAVSHMQENGSND